MNVGHRPVWLKSIVAMGVLTASSATAQESPPAESETKSDSQSMVEPLTAPAGAPTVAQPKNKDTESASASPPQAANAASASGEGQPSTLEAESQDSAKTIEKKEASKGAGNANVAAATGNIGAGRSGLSWLVSLDHNFGTGTFVDIGQYGTIFGTLAGGPNYSFKIKDQRMLATARASLSWEYSRPDLESGRRVFLSDVGVGLRALQMWKWTQAGINFTPLASLTLPTSYESWTSGQLSNISAGILAERIFGNLYLAFTSSAVRGLHTSRVTGRKGKADDAGIPVTLCRAGETYCDVAANNVAWGLRGALIAAYSLTDHINFSAFYQLGTNWSYGVGEDGDIYTPRAVDSSGNLVAVSGAGRTDFSRASVGGGYQIDEHFNISAYVATDIPPRTNDNNAFRFPLFSFRYLAQNYSSIGLTLQMVY